MTPYKNLSGKSSVVAYTYTESSFTVRFKDNISYLYSIDKNPQGEINRMHTLADSGIGLGTMLATKPHHPHDRKW